MKKTLARLLAVSIFLLPARPALAEGPAVAVFSAAAKILVVAVPVAGIIYLIYKKAGGGEKKEEKPEQAPAEKKAEPAKGG